MPDFMGGNVVPQNQALVSAIQGKPDQLTTQNPSNDNPLLSWIKSRSGYDPLMSIIPGTPQWQAAGHAKNQQSMGQHAADLLGYVGMAFPGGARGAGPMMRDSMMAAQGHPEAILPPQARPQIAPNNAPKPMNPDSVIGRVDQLKPANETISAPAYEHWLDNLPVDPRVKEVIAENQHRVSDPEFMKDMNDFQEFLNSIEGGGKTGLMKETPQGNVTNIGGGPSKWLQLAPEDLQMYTDMAVESLQQKALSALQQGDMETFKKFQLQSNAVGNLEHARSNLQSSLQELNKYSNTTNKETSERFNDILKRANHYQDLIDQGHKVLDSLFGHH